MKAIRFGVIGCGDMGRTHTNILTDCPGAEPVAVCDMNPQAARSAGETFNVKSYLTHSEMLRRSDIDAVVIATPHPSHFEVAMQVLECGVHVLVEKPMAVTVREAEDMIRLAERKRLLLGVDYQHRTRPADRKAYEILSSGMLGPLMHVTLDHSTIRTDSYYNSAAWRGTWKGEAGGVMINQSAHHLDTLQWLTGMPSEIFAWADTAVHDIQTEDVVTAMLRYPNGAHGKIHLSTSEVPVEQFEIACQKGKLVLECSGWAPSGPLADTANVKLIVIYSKVLDFIRTNKGMYDVPARKQEEYDFTYNDEESWPLIVDNFVESLMTGKQILVPGTEGIKSLELINAMLLSSKKRMSVKLPVDRLEYDALLQTLKEQEGGEATGSALDGVLPKSND